MTKPLVLMDFPQNSIKSFGVGLKHFLLRSYNHSYDKELLSVTLRNCIITCLPKGDKARDLLKNWRPLSMLSVLYKIVSAAIANRLKTVLDSIISKTQCGFIKNRYIGESTRLIYDIMDHTERKKLTGLLMLIDFEKAFDSVSWLYLYKTLEHFNFGPDFIKWIKLLNTKISASVIQCGILSEPIQILRGCRQGDPIAAYLFLLCGQNLFKMIDKNANIKGIIIDGIEYKMTQFADDTTLILDGSQESLQASLNTLETFGSISGLKMNCDKTKVIWIGRKKLCKEKLKATINLDWGATVFTLLGITFSTNLHEMIEINFQKAIIQIQSQLKNWKRRLLTPIGKITLIKTFMVPKLNHLFSAIPSPSETLLKEISKLFYNFIWDNKPDKISRQTLTQKYSEGGLKMVNIVNHMHAIKATWIRRLLLGSPTNWTSLFNSTICTISNLPLFGTFWYQYIGNKTQNPFWKDVFKAHVNIQTLNPLDTVNLLAMPLWYNPKISKHPLINKHWYKQGITFLGDILNENGEIKDQTTLQNQYELRSNWLEYRSVHQTVSRFLSKHRSTLDVNQPRPFVPQDVLFHGRIL